MSRLAKKPITIPSGVKVEFVDSKLTIEGPKGKLQHSTPVDINLEIKNGQIKMLWTPDKESTKALVGLNYVLIANMIKGVTQGYSKQLEIIGVGWRAQIQDKNLNLQLGFSHPVIFPMPEGIKIETPKPTQIVVRGADKQMVGDIAAQIRAICPPEPYKGKGIRYLGEYVRKKIGKAAATK